jgi:sulfur-oxidizing protein SoxB
LNEVCRQAVLRNLFKKARVTGIEVILGGHTHDGVPVPVIVSNPGGKTIVTNAGSNGKFLGVLNLEPESHQASSRIRENP